MLKRYRQEEGSPRVNSFGLGEVPPEPFSQVAGRSPPGPALCAIAAVGTSPSATAALDAIELVMLTAFHSRHFSSLLVQISISIKRSAN